jgi:AraC family transcriptional regulator of adaptative response/methylated-DNA-[protein]-cysteine methyltransferase
MSASSIGFTVRDTSLGRLLVAASERGVCWVCFGESDAALEASLSAEFPFASLQRDDARLSAWSGALVERVEGSERTPEPPLDVAGSAFQRRVWGALRAIPRGATRSYSEVAAAIGRPGAARAVARACASNRLPVVIPCHRVVEKGGALGGYAGGVWRKRALLRGEGVSGADPDGKRLQPDDEVRRAPRRRLVARELEVRQAAHDLLEEHA